MFNPDFKFSHHKAIALILLVVSVFLLKQMRTDLKAGPLVVESYPSHVAESEVVDYGSAREPLIGALDSVDVESDPNDDIFPVGNLNSYSAQDRVLIESVISIIQGYYVDNHRVSNSDLYGSSLSVLKKILPDFEKSGGLIKFKDGEKIYSFLDRSGKRISYNTLIKQIMRHHALAQKVLKKRGNQEEHAVLRGMLQNLDAHSAMLLPQDYEDLKQGTEGVFGGLGVLVGMRNDVLTVIKPIPNSPAARMGISRNDKILSIDGHKTYGATLDDLIEHMRGKPGTKVQLEILKDNAPSPTKFTVKREVIKVDSVTSKIFKHGKNEFLYISIDNFAARTTVELSGAIKDFRKKHKGSIPGLVLDLRSNPGGLLDQAVSVADLFLKEGVIVSTRGRRSEVERATVGESETDFPMVVLINSDSASASEIVAGALQDHGRALVIGQQSFGKGSVQTVFELPGQRAIKLTIARYYTPKGRTIQNEGILPDIVFQPVFVKNENSNLLGDYRYRGEGALNHALTTKSLLKRNNSRAIFQSFYLADKLNQYDLSPGADREFELSKIFLKSISEHYGNNIPKGLRRVDHQLFIASKEIQNYLRYQSTSVTKFLSEKFKVRWGGKRFGSEKLSLQIRSTERIPVIPGKNAIIPIRIFNTGDEQVNNVSISLQTEQAGMISREILIGMVPPRGTIAQNISIKIPSFWERNLIDANLALAVNGSVVSERSQFKFDIKSRVPAVLSALVKLVGEKGGKLRGTLEPNEQAKLELEITNESEAPANATDIRILNLAGKQISIDENFVKGVKIPPKGKKKLLFNIKGSTKLYDDKLVLGLFLNSNDLVKPYRKELNIQGNPRIDMPAERLAH